MAGSSGRGDVGVMVLGNLFKMGEEERLVGDEGERKWTRVLMAEGREM